MVNGSCVIKLIGRSLRSSSAGSETAIGVTVCWDGTARAPTVVVDLTDFVLFSGDFGGADRAVGGVTDSALGFAGTVGGFTGAAEGGVLKIGVGPGVESGGTG